MIQLILIFILYIYPTYRCIKFDRAYYSLNGKGHKEKPTIKELIVAFIPIINITYIVFLYGEYDYPYTDTYKRELDRLEKEKPLHPILKKYFNK